MTGFVTRNEAPDGGPLNYRVSHRVQMWRKGQQPKLQPLIVEGDVKLSA